MDHLLGSLLTYWQWGHKDPGKWNTLELILLRCCEVNGTDPERPHMLHFMFKWPHSAFKGAMELSSDSHSSTVVILTHWTISIALQIIKKFTSIIIQIIVCHIIYEKSSFSLYTLVYPYLYLWHLAREGCMPAMTRAKWTESNNDWFVWASRQSKHLNFYISGSFFTNIDVPCKSILHN